MIRMVEPKYKVEYEIIIQCNRDGRLYYDTYYSVGGTVEDALDEVTKLWHENNDHLAKIHGDIRFFMEVE